MKPVYRFSMHAVAAAFAFATVSAIAQTSPAVKDDKAQTKSDKAALKSEEKQLKADQAQMKKDKASGKMAAESKDSERVYKDQQAIKGSKSIEAAEPGCVIATPIQCDESRHSGDQVGRVRG